MLCHEIQEYIGLFRLVRRPAEIIGLHGVMAFREVPISQAPSGSREETKRCGQTAFFLWVRACARTALAVIGAWRPQKGHGSIPQEQVTLGGLDGHTRILHLSDLTDAHLQ
jgi:hypothetical protein